MAESNHRDFSLIKALHRQYERATAALDVIDNMPLGGESAAPPDGTWGRDEAAGVVTNELNALEAAILHQVPGSWAEALILLFHLRSACDHVTASTTRNQAASERLHLAVDTLFDFMCCEIETGGDTIPAALGMTLETAAARALRNRRLRTGMLEA